MVDLSLECCQEQSSSDETKLQSNQAPHTPINLTVAATLLLTIRILSSCTARHECVFLLSFLEYFIMMHLTNAWTSYLFICKRHQNRMSMGQPPAALDIQPPPLLARLGSRAAGRLIFTSFGLLISNKHQPGGSQPLNAHRKECTKLRLFQHHQQHNSHNTPTNATIKEETSRFRVRGCMHGPFRSLGIQMLHASFTVGGDEFSILLGRAETLSPFIFWSAGHDFAIGTALPKINNTNLQIATGSSHAASLLILGSSAVVLVGTSLACSKLHLEATKLLKSNVTIQITAGSRPGASLLILGSSVSVFDGTSLLLLGASVPYLVAMIC